MSWIIVCIAMGGLILNAKGKWQGFLCWLISNAWWCHYNFVKEEYSQAVLFALLWIATIYGIWYWRKKKRDANKKRSADRAKANKKTEILLHQNFLQRQRIRSLSDGLFGKKKKKKKPRRSRT